nr:reverse transcriptase domain-containing protein [Tanacetum cinerariifolium]
MSIRLADRSFQYLVGIAENMLVEVGKFTFLADFIILEMEEDSKVSLTWDDLFSIPLMQLFESNGNNSILENPSRREIFSKFDAFIGMTVDENSESKSDNEETPFEKININTDFKIKTSLEEPLTDLELKPLPDNLEYVFLEEPSFFPVIISSKLSAQNKSKLVSILKKHKEAFS